MVVGKKRDETGQLTQLVTVSDHLLQSDLVFNEQADLYVHRIEVFLKLLIPSDRLHYFTLKHLYLHFLVIITLCMQFNKINT